MTTSNRANSIAALLCVCLACPALSQTASQNARPRSAQRVIVIEHSGAPVWPLYSRFCEYKTVMNNEDMHRCGVFLNIGRYPSADLVRNR